MKVLHVTNNYPTTNFPIFGIFVKEQIDSLNKLDINNNVFFINTREYGKFHYITSIFRLFYHLIFNRYDLIHCHHAFSGLTLLFTGFMFFKKTVISYQSNPSIEGGKLLFSFFHFFVSKIIIKNSIEEYILFNKVEVLPNGVNLDFFKPLNREDSKKLLNLERDKIYILFMDSYNKRVYKRIDRFLNVIEILKNKFKFLNIEPLILTNTQRDHIPFYINSSHLHLLTSDIEGSPNSVKECLACNVNVVTTPVGGCSDLLNGVNGSYVSSSFEALELATLVINALDTTLSNGRNSIIDKNLDSLSIALKLKKLYFSIYEK